MRRISSTHSNQHDSTEYFLISGSAQPASIPSKDTITQQTMRASSANCVCTTAGRRLHSTHTHSLIACRRVRRQPTAMCDLICPPKRQQCGPQSYRAPARANRTMRLTYVYACLNTHTHTHYVAVVWPLP